MLGLLEIPVTGIEKFQYGGKMLLIGMGTIFAVLAILWGCLELMHFLIGKASKKQENTQKSENIPAPQKAPVAPTASAIDEEDEIVAAICAAIAAAEAEHPQLQFRAVAFKRIH